MTRNFIYFIKFLFLSQILLQTGCTSKEEVEKAIEGEYDTRIVSVFEDSTGLQTADTSQMIINIEVKDKDRLYFSSPDKTFNYNHKDKKISDTEASGSFKNDSVYLFVNALFESDYTLYEGRKIE